MLHLHITKPSNKMSSNPNITIITHATHIIQMANRIIRHTATAQNENPPIPVFPDLITARITDIRDHLNEIEQLISAPGPTPFLIQPEQPSNAAPAIRSALEHGFEINDFQHHGECGCFACCQIRQTRSGTASAVAVCACGVKATGVKLNGQPICECCFNRYIKGESASDVLNPTR